MATDDPAEPEMEAKAYRTLGDSFAMAMALLDADLTIRWTNPAAGRVLGWPDRGIVGRNAAELVHPDDIVNLLPVASEMSALAITRHGPLTPSAPVELPCRILREDGDWTPMVATGRIVDAEGTILAVLRPSAERHALAEVLDGFGNGVPIEQLLGALVWLIQAQFDTRTAWMVHDIGGRAEVVGGDDEPLPLDPVAALGRLRGLDGEDWFVLVEGDFWLVPVQSGEADRAFGAFVLPATRPEGPSPWDELVAHRTANLAAVAFARDLRDRMLRVAATTDHLTGVLNRREFERSLRKIPGSSMPITLFFLDLDDFKDVNDDFGHLAGDAVLANVARRLQGVVRSRDRVGRLGGDEFVVSCPSLADADVEPTRARIASVVREPVSIDGRKLAVTASVGVARAYTDDQLESLINRSDADMFQRKRRAKERSAGQGGPVHTDALWPR